MFKSYDLKELKQFEPDFLEKDKSGRGWVCPLCHSGSGPHGTGITQNKHNPTQYTCWSCQTSGSVIDWFQYWDQLDSFREAVQGCAQYFGLDGDTPYETHIAHPRIGQKPVPKFQKNFWPTSHSGYGYECYVNNMKNGGQYLLKRGISLETQKKFLVGYDPHWKNPQTVWNWEHQGKDPSRIPESTRCLIFTSRTSYLARDVFKNGRYSKQKVGDTHIWNWKVLEQPQIKPVFVVEGEIDAMSIVDGGGLAIGLGGTSGVKQLLNRMSQHPNPIVFLLCLDNDEPGQQASKKLEAGLKKLNLPFGKTNSPVGKDPNEFLMTSRSEFQSWIRYENSKITDILLDGGYLHA